MNQGKNSFKNLILYIIGTTAAGKTKLSLALGQKFHGQIISCDSMQIYKQVDIMTAKATQKEQSLVKHHMLDELDLKEQNFNRNDYYFKSAKIAEDIQKQNNIPVIVGGTHYYIETLLFKQNVSDKKDTNFDQLGSDFDKMTNLELYNKLKELDPLLANKTHPNNAKRVKQYLNIILNTDSEQPLSSQMEDHMEVPLRNENCLVFWPRCKEREKLKEQQLKRIKEMIGEGGLEEAIVIIDELIGSDIIIDQNTDIEQPLENEQALLQRGVLQSIGYKEFLPIYKFIKQNYDGENYTQKQLETFIENNEEGKKILDSCIERLYFNTYHMSKKQIQWIKHRIITNSNSKQIKKRMFTLDFDEYTSQNFNENVIEPAISVTQEYINLLKDNNVEESLDLLNNNPDLNKYLLKEEEIEDIRKVHNKKSLDDWKNYYCDICDLELCGQQQYETHMNSKKHKKVVAHLEKLKNMDPNSQHYKAIMKKKQEKQQQKDKIKFQQISQQQQEEYQEQQNQPQNQ